MPSPGTTTPARLIRAACLAAATASLAAWLGCAATRESERRERAASAPVLSDAEERVLGARLAALVRERWEPLGDRIVVGYVQRLGDRLARISARPEIPYHFAVVADGAPRAFALPGGYVYVSTGLLARLGDQSELAGILAHEIAHVASRHAARAAASEIGRDGVTEVIEDDRPVPRAREARDALRAILDGYPEKEELAADRSAVLYASRVRLDPHGYLRALERMEFGGIEGWESRSLGAGERVEHVRARIQALGLTARLPSNPNPFGPIRERVR